MNKEQIDLEPCPFCGGFPWIHKGMHGWVCECDNCGMNIGWFGTEQEAIDKWNTRYIQQIKTINN